MAGLKMNEEASGWSNVEKSTRESQLNSSNGAFSVGDKISVSSAYRGSTEAMPGINHPDL